MKNDQISYQKNYKPFLGGDDQIEDGYQRSYMDPRKARDMKREQDRKRKKQASRWSTASAYYAPKTEWSSSQAYGDPRLETATLAYSYPAGYPFS